MSDRSHKGASSPSENKGRVPTSVCHCDTLVSVLSVLILENPGVEAPFENVRLNDGVLLAFGENSVRIVEQLLKKILASCRSC